MDIQPVTINDIASFVQTVVTAFSPTLFYSFTLMLAVAVAVAIKKIAVDV